ncbi:hypothetical protein E4U17_007343, partial [Claviceps sp. LM77 group G4]
MIHPISPWSMVKILSVFMATLASGFYQPCSPIRCLHPRPSILRFYFYPHEI